MKLSKLKVISDAGSPWKGLKEDFVERIIFYGVLLGNFTIVSYDEDIGKSPFLIKSKSEDSTYIVPAAPQLQLLFELVPPKAYIVSSSSELTIMF